MFRDDSQNCISCKENFLFQEDKKNCVDKCLDGYYEENKYCKNCNSSCLTCNKGFSDNSPHCTSCKNNKTLINDTKECNETCDITYYKNETENKCYKCNSNCKSCSEGSKNGNNYCLSCNENSTYKYLVNAKGFDKNCVEKCPNSTILNQTINQCIIKENKEEEDYYFYKIIFIILTIILIAAIIISIYCIYNAKDSNDNDIINEINTELN